MNLTRTIILVAGIIILCNYVLFFLVLKAQEKLILATAINTIEVIVLGIVSWYALKKQTRKRKN